VGEGVGSLGGVGVVFCRVGGRFAWVGVLRAIPIGLFMPDVRAFRDRLASFPGPTHGLSHTDVRTFRH